MWRRLTGVRGLSGLRRALLAAAQLSLAAMAAAVVLSPEQPQRWDGLALAALVALGLRWGHLYATERPSLPLDVCEGVAVGVLALSLGGGNVMPVILAGLSFRSQYAGRGRVLTGAVIYAAVEVGVTIFTQTRFPDYTVIAALTLVPLLLMVPTAAAELARGLAAFEAGLRRERALALAVTSYLDAAGLDALAARSEQAVQEVLGDRLSGSAVVLNPACVDAMRERLLADGGETLEFPVPSYGAVLVAHVTPLDGADRRWLATLAGQLALAAAAVEARSARAAAAGSRRIGTLVERTGGVALLIDPELVITSASPGTLEVLGHPPEALHGRSVLDLLHRVDRERGREALVSALAGDPLAPERVTLRLSGDGVTVRWVELSVADLRGDEAVAAFVIQAHDVSARVALEEDARRRDDHDPLTGLPNREQFERAVAAELLAGNERLAVALIDLDDFRLVNETLGHATGDEVLAEVAGMLEDAAAGVGLIARVAGDDFAILLPAVVTGGAGCEAVERILRVLDRPLTAGPGTLRLSASAGLARVTRDLRSPKALLAAADAALEAAHAGTRGRCRLFAPVQHAERLERAVLQAELAAGIRAGQLELDYQPVVDAESGVWHSAEALVRWRHPELGRVGPDRFIGLAERTELIVALGEWVLGEACRQLAAWRADHVVPADFGVAVNVSGVQLVRSDLIDHVRAALGASGLPPGCLTLEITETAMIDMDAVLPRLSQLKALGVRIAIDDFGTGHSSLAYLKDLPADVVKVPRPFVRDAGRTDRGTALIQGIVGLLRPLGLLVLAEGVETRQQRECVLAAGCQLIQGHLYSAPMRPAQFAAQAPSATQPHVQPGAGPHDDAGGPGPAARLVPSRR